MMSYLAELSPWLNTALHRNRDHRCAWPASPVVIVPVPALTLDPGPRLSGAIAPAMASGALERRSVACPL